MQVTVNNRKTNSHSQTYNIKDNFRLQFHGSSTNTQWPKA